MSNIPQIIENKIAANEEILIDLGCGPNKKSGFIGVDFLQLPGVDIVANVETQGLHFLPDSCVDVITSSHFMEHLSDLNSLMTEMHRVLKPEGFNIIVVPHFSNPYYYSDHTHKLFFGYYTFDYFAVNSKAKRKVPMFYGGVKYEIISKKLVFHNYPFKIRGLIRSVFTRIFNFNVFLQELYEGWFTWILPCSEIHVKLKPIKKN